MKIECDSAQQGGLVSRRRRGQPLLLQFRDDEEIDRRARPRFVPDGWNRRACDRLERPVVGGDRVRLGRRRVGNETSERCGQQYDERKSRRPYPGMAGCCATPGSDRMIGRARRSARAEASDSRRKPAFFQSARRRARSDAPYRGTYEMSFRVRTFWVGARSLPKGESRIARQFTAGSGFAITKVPKGRPKRSSCFSRPFGTGHFCSTIPPLKGWAIVKSPFGRWETNPRQDPMKTVVHRDQ